MNASTPFSPIALVGTFALLAAFLVAAWCVAAGIAGNALKSRRLVTSSVYGLYGFAALITLSSVLLIYAFVTHDFAIKYVAQVSDTTMETWYKVTAFWGGLDARSCCGCWCWRCSRRWRSWSTTGATAT